MKEPDANELVKAMVKEVESHEENKHFTQMPRTEVPEGTKVLDSVWSMKRKSKQFFGAIKKCKSRLNMHSGQMEHGINCRDTCSPVVQWPS